MHFILFVNPFFVILLFETVTTLVTVHSRKDSVLMTGIRKKTPASSQESSDPSEVIHHCHSDLIHTVFPLKKDWVVSLPVTFKEVSFIFSSRLDWDSYWVFPLRFRVFFFRRASSIETKTMSPITLTRFSIPPKNTSE